MKEVPQWLDWAQQLAALAQSGLAYSQNPFEIERYNQIRKIAAGMLSAYGNEPIQRVNSLLAEQEGYATPKLDVRGVVFKDNRVLLVKDACSSGSRAMHETAVLNLANRLYGGGVADAARAAGLLRGSRERVWRNPGPVPFRFAYETSSALYDSL